MMRDNTRAVVHVSKRMYNAHDHWEDNGTTYITPGPVLLVRHDAVPRILDNGNAAFFESCAAIAWKDCDSIRSL